MKITNAEIYVDGLAVHLAYRYRKPFRVWSDMSDKECQFWKDEAYELLIYLKRQNTKTPHQGKKKKIEVVKSNAI